MYILDYILYFINRYQGDNKYFFKQKYAIRILSLRQKEKFRNKLDFSRKTC